MSVSNVDLNKIKDQLSVLSIKEMVQLTDILKEEWNISAITTMAGSAAAPAEAAAEKTEFDLILLSAGDKKIEVIKTIREIVSGLGLKEAKDLVDGAPTTVKQGIAKSDAEALKAKLEAAGAKAEIK